MSGLPVVPSEQLGELLVYATRYAIGRQTYAVDDVCRMVRQYWSDIPANDRATIQRDLNSATMDRVPLHETRRSLLDFIRRQR